MYMLSAPSIYGNDEAWLAEGVAAVRTSNEEVRPFLEDLRRRRFFRLYAADLLAGCSYMPTSEEPCELGECEVDAAEDVPDELVSRCAPREPAAEKKRPKPRPELDEAGRAQKALIDGKLATARARAEAKAKGLDEAQTAALIAERTGAAATASNGT